MPEETPISEGPVAPRKLHSPKTGLILLIIGIVLLIAVVVFLIFSILPAQKAQVWQAVFLTNGQVYFGHVAKTTETSVVLRNVYYLQVQQLMPKEGKEPQQQLTLVRLGQEMHGPENEMEINRAHILFVEKLRKDSQVVTTIEAQQTL